MSKNSTQFLETQFPLGELGILLGYFAFSPVFEEQGLVQVVIARPAMGQVPSSMPKFPGSMPKCDLQSLF